MSPKPELALALLRLLLGVCFAAHGYHAIFGQGLGLLSAQYRAQGVPLPLLTAPLVATLQLAGGVLLALGLGVRPIAAALALVTAVAAYFAHQRPVFLGPDGLELPLLLMGGSLALLLGGPGALAFEGFRGALPEATELAAGKNGAARATARRGKRRKAEG